MAGKAQALEVAFGKVVRTLRTEAGLSQEALAHAADLHTTYVSQLERGLKSPSLRTISTLAEALGTRPSTLVQRAERSAKR